jgi:hypothetical protein
VLDLGFADDLKRLCASSTGGVSPSHLLSMSAEQSLTDACPPFHSIASHFGVAQGHAVRGPRPGPSATRPTLTKLSARLLQGTHDKIVADLLANEHGIPRKWIVIDKGR